ncbi:MAG: methionyl-tRNA formyltransferase [Candidatus Rokuibacteriota bacterium]
MKVLFYGTPAFALPTFEALRRAHTIVTVITQPDRPAHRGQKLTPPPIKLAALQAGLPVIQPPRLRDPEWPERLRALGADIAVVVAFGQILPTAVLDAPARGSINIHGSLLPKYRGAAPIQWALIRGETVTGITTFQMDAGMDTGAMLLRVETPIGPEETAGELSERLARLGAEVMLDTLARLDSLKPTPQPEGATLAPRLKKTDGAIDWQRPARQLVDLLRGCNPWPGATTTLDGGALTLWRARVVPGTGTPGTLVAHERSLAIVAGEGAVLPLEVQPESRRALAWDEFLRGARLTAGQTLTSR